jgi:uncharacterized protein with HEPN domain
LTVIGEAAKQLPEAVRRRAPEVPWREVAGLRDVIVHAYFRVDIDILWSIATRDMPRLQSQVRQILESFGDVEPI